MTILTGVLLLIVEGTVAAQAVPDMKPGDTCDKLRAAYGNELSQDGPAHIWRQNGVTIRVLVRPDGPCVAGDVEYSVDAGHTYTTRDGIILGKDTISEAKRKLQGRIDDTSYMSILWAGKAYGQFVVPPSRSVPFTGTYSWQLRKSVAGALTGPPKFTDFMNEPAIAYSIDVRDGEGRVK